MTTQDLVQSLKRVSVRIMDFFLALDANPYALMEAEVHDLRQQVGALQPRASQPCDSAEKAA